MQQGIPQLQINMPALGNPGNDDVLEHQAPEIPKPAKAGLLLSWSFPQWGTSPYTGMCWQE